MNLWSSRPARQADITLHFARDLSQVASSFGAATDREARRRPGGFNRPVVGRDPEYYARAASRVFGTAVQSDPELSQLYFRAELLSTAVSHSVIPPYEIAGPRVSEAKELATVGVAIQAALAEKDLKIRLAGNRLETAEAISAFAIRVIEGTGSNELHEEYGSLYPGLRPEAAVNRVDYWQSLQAQLATPVKS